MNLYTTVSSERASKGQGGKYLHIHLQGEDGMTLARMRLNQSEAQPDEYELSIDDRSPYLTIVEDGQEIDRKGEKQKSETCYMCGNPQCPNTDKDGFCMNGTR